MAKTKYNPLSAFKEDPLAALKTATDGSNSNRGSDSIRSVEASESANAVQEASSQRDTILQQMERSNAPVKPLSANLQTSRNTVYLYPEDLTKLRQLSGYASTEHGIRANDSMIVRAALALLEPDVRLLHALKETELLDRRRRGRA